MSVRGRRGVAGNVWRQQKERAAGEGGREVIRGCGKRGREDRGEQGKTKGREEEGERVEGGQAPGAKRCIFPVLNEFPVLNQFSTSSQPVLNPVLNLVSL